MTDDKKVVYIVSHITGSILNGIPTESTIHMNNIKIYSVDGQILKDLADVRRFVREVGSEYEANHKNSKLYDQGTPDDGPAYIMFVDLDTHDFDMYSFSVGELQ